ncbi:DUF4426 domain-containing protein [Marinobacter fuscus]|uniref:DUF4426 domain-containing protein n=1 Tax=Marinobacter fuscus TaxID=2109942 RepID=A0A2T1KRQ6_9GAMM|nr:DUF4426 domain-containing protein [Marinobacter fuscus]PSF12322.1 DUF4426 domain-containing protein [Marinobacter fuscus]
MITQHLQRFALTLAALVALALPALASAGEKDFGDYRVHWSVFPSTFLTPEVAKANNLQRSKGIGVVNISIMTDDEHGQIQPVSGQVEGQVANDIQQINFLAFRRIQEGDAVYFIAQYQYQSGELMTFNIKARPSGHGEDLAVRFAHSLFND